MIAQQLTISGDLAGVTAAELLKLRDDSYRQSTHPLSSSNLSTKTCLVAIFSVLNNISRNTRNGEVSANGIDPSTVEASLYAWSDGIAKNIGDKKFQAILLGAFEKAVETLKQGIDIKE